MTFACLILCLGANKRRTIQSTMDIDSTHAPTRAGRTLQTNRHATSCAAASEKAIFDKLPLMHLLINSGHHDILLSLFLFDLDHLVPLSVPMMANHCASERLKKVSEMLIQLIVKVGDTQCGTTLDVFLRHVQTWHLFGKSYVAPPEDKTKELSLCPQTYIIDSKLYSSYEHMTSYSQYARLVSPPHKEYIDKKIPLFWLPSSK